VATVTFDTHKFIKTLEEAGVPETQAEAFSTAVQESHGAAELATKVDIAKLCKDMDAKLKKLELRMTIKLGSIVIAGLGVMTLIFKIL
jgi:hypothetical protein